MIVSALKEFNSNEKRVALTPMSASMLIKEGIRVIIQKDAGVLSNFSDEDYKKVGAEVEDDIKNILKETDVILLVSSIPTDEHIKYAKENSIIIGAFNPYENSSELKKLLIKNINVISLDFLPRISRAQSMDVLSSQANLAGYKAVIEASNLFKKVMPMMMTAAGTIIPAKCLVLGAGVAGLQAIATAKRLGCIVSAFDVRPEVEEQVKSLGAKFIKVDTEESNKTSKSGYATEMSASYKVQQQNKIDLVAADMDIIIATALIPGKKAPILITKETLSKMKTGSVIIDLAGIGGGNTEGAILEKKILIEDVLVYAPENLPSSISYDASLLYSKNIVSFILCFISDKKLDIDKDDELLNESLIIKNGKKTNKFFEK